MCEECPFRGKDRATKISMATTMDILSCHLDDGPEGISESSSGIQCRGHWEAKRKANPSKNQLPPTKKNLPTPKPKNLAI